MILSNQAKCLKCGDTPYSASRHDFQRCKCGEMAVDGGMDYIRRLGDSKDMSIVISDEQYELLADAVESKEHNTLGKVCLIARILRDNFGVNIGELS